MDEARLIEKLRLIEALFAGAKTSSEAAAASAQQLPLAVEDLDAGPGG